MSAQSGKKKRMGSRRRGGNQSERSEPDEFHVKDSTSVVQANIPEENTESLNMLSNSDYSQLETKHPPSPELIGNRRKLGSSRRSKGRQHVTSVTEPYNKPREEVEENTSNETFEPTQMSLAIQPERHTELSQGNEHDILYVTHDSSLYSVTTPGYSSEVYNPSGSEVDLESLIPKNENLQAEHDQTETDCEVVSDSCKIMLGGTNKSDTLESAEVSDQLEQNAHHVGTSDFISSSSYLSSTVDQELIDQLKSREMPGEELPSVDSVTDTENKKRDDDTDLLRQDGNLQGNYLVSESYVKSEDIEFSSTPETTTVKSSFGENTEIENNVERATFSLPTEELSTNEELNVRFNLSEVKDDQHSEDAVNKEHKQEVKASQMQEMHQIDYSSESVIHDATEKSDTCPENLIDQAEIRDTYQSELSVKSSDDSVPKQEISNPDENQDEHHIKERNMEALDQRNEDDHVSNTKEPWISNIAPCQVCEGEGQVEDNIKPSAEETVHQVKEGIISEFEEGKSSLQNLQSEINAPLDSQPQGDSISIEEQTDSSFNPIGNRRKMGSSRRNKGKQHIKDSVAESYHKPTEEVVENMRGSEAFETTKISSATEPIWQEQLSQESEPEMTHDNSLYSATTPGYSSEVQNLTTTNHPETVLEGLLPKSENVQAHDDERETDSTVVSDVCESVETMLEERDKSDTPQTEDISDQVKETLHLVDISALTSISVHSSSTADQQLNDQSNSREMSNEELPSLYSITDTENKERDDDTNMLRQDGILQVNYLTRESHVESEDVEFSTTPEVTTDKTSFGENTEIEYNVERATFSLPTEELSTNEELNEHFNLSEVKDDQHSEDAVNKGLVQEVKPTQMQEMHQIDYSSESVIHDATEKSDTCSENLIDQAEISDMYQSELSVKSSDDSVPKQEISNPDENQDEHHIKERNMEALDQRNEDDHVSNKRKMGSSRRNKGKRHIKDSVAESYHKPTEEVVENMRGSEAFETTKISLATEPVWQEQLSQESEPEMTHDKSLYSATTPGYSSEVQNLTTTNHPETVLEGLLSKSENVQAHDDERETDSTVVSDVCESVETMLEERDKSDTPQTEDISDQVKETSHLVGISALTSISVHSSSTADQQLNDQSNSREMSNEELPSLYSITDTENKERDDNTNLLRQDGILQVNYLTRESHVESEDVELSTTPEVTTDKTSFRENTEIEYNVERATFSLPTEELSTNEELNEHFNLSEVKDDQHSEDAVNKGLVQEVKPTQMQEMHQIDYSSESVIHDATEKSDTCSENLIDQAEISDMYQSELSVKSSDDSVPKQEISNPDENQDEHHIKERNMEALDQRNEDDHVSNKRKMGSSRRNKGKRHIKDSVAESYHKPTEEVVENMRGSEAFETTKISLATEPVWQEQLSQESEPEMTHDKSLYSATTPGYSSEVQNLTTTNHPETVLEGLLSKSENVQAHDDERETDSTVVSDVCESVETMLEERDKSDTPQTEDISDQVKETSHLVGISALTSISVHSSSTADQQLNDQSNSREMSNEELPSLYSITDTENKERDDNTNLLRQDGILQVNYLTRESHVESEDVELSTTPEVTTDKTSFRKNTEIEYNVERATFSLPTEELSTNEELNEHFNLSEVKDDQHSEDAVNKGLVQEVKPTQMQEMHQIDYSSESVIHDATEKSDTCSENLIDQAEISDMYQSELSVKSSDDSVPKQEISNPDENQDEHHIKERNMEALDQRNEDDHVSNKRKMGSSRRNKGKRHIKDSVAESYHKPTEEVVENMRGSEAFETTKISLATEPVWQEQLSQESEPEMTHDKSLYSATTPGYSSEVQNLTTTNHPETVLEGLLPKSENVQAHDDERETDSTVVSDVCESVETMLEERDKSDTPQTEDISDQVKETSHLVGISALTSISVHSSSTADQQLNDQSNSRETSNEELPSVYSMTDTENKERGDDTNMLRQDGILQVNYLTRESHVESEDVEFSTTPEVTTDKTSFRENTEIEYNVEQATFSLPTEELSTNEGLNEHFNLSEVKDDQLSEDAVNKEHKQEVKASQMQEMHQIDYSSESVIQDATEKSDTCSENLIDQAEIRDTYQSELSVKSSDDSVPKQEISNPDENQDEHHIKERNMEALDQRNEDDHVSNTKEPWISNIASCQGYEGEGQVEDDIQPSAEEKVHQEREELLHKVEEREYYLQNLQSEINATLDSQPQGDSISIEEQTDSSLNPIGNRRKMGSSRRNKGKRHIKDSVAESYHKPTEEVVENMRGSEAFETTKISSATEPVWQEQLSQEIEPEMTHDNSLYSATTPGYSSEVQNLTTTNHPETVLEGLLPKSENVQAHDDERETDSTVVSDVCESVETMLEERDKSDTPQTEDISDQVKETSHLVGISALTSISVHSSSTADQQLNDQSNSREMSNEELPSLYSITDTENKERDDNTNLLRQDGILQVNYLTHESHVESEDVEFSTTPEVTTDKTSFGENTEIEYNVEQATFSLPTEELSTNEGLNEHFNLSEVKDDQHSEDAVNKEYKQEVKASQMQEMHQIDYSSESVIHDATEKSDTCSENLIDQAEIRDTYQSELSVKSTDDSATEQDISNPDDKQDEHSIEESSMQALNQRNEDDHVSNTKEPWINNIAPCQVYEGEGQVEDDIQPSAEETVHQVKEGILSEFEEGKSSLQTQQSEINATLDSQPQGDSISIEEQTDSSFNPIRNRRKMGSSRRNKGRRYIKDPAAESYYEPTEEVVENMRGSEAFETMKISLATEPIWQEQLSQESEPEMTHDNSLYSATTPGYSSEVQNLTTTNHPETVLEGLLSKSENVQAHDDERETDSAVVSDVCKSVETMLEERDKSDTPQTEDISDQVKETSHLVGISALTSISVHSSSTADQQLNDQSNSREMSNEELPSVYSITDTENKERDDDTNLLRRDGILQVNYLTRESHVESEDVEFSTTPEVTTDKTSFGENTEIEYNVEQATFSSPTEELSTNEELNEHFNLPEVKDDQHSEDAVNKEHKQEVKASQMQEMHQIDYSSESVIHDATEKSDTCPENLIDQAEIRDTYQSELSVKSTDDSATKQDISNPDKQDDIQPSAEETVHQVKEGILSEFEEGKSSLQTQQSEINATLDSQPQGDSISIEEQTDSSFNPIRNRRKMGSSRRNKGRRYIKDPAAESYYEPTEEVVGNTRDNEILQAMKRSLIIEAPVEEKLVETMLEEMDKLDTSQTDEVSEQLKENAQEMPNEELPNVYSVTYSENKERDEDTELLGHHGNLQGNYLVSESHVKSAKYHENTEIVYSVEKAMISSPNGRLSINEEQNEHFILAEVRDAQHLEDTVNKVHEQGDKPTQMHEMDQTDHSSFKEGKSSLHTLQSGTHSPLGSLRQDDSVSIKEQTHTGVNPTVNRRKMGSSRRQKGRQPVKDFVAVSDMDPKDEVIENTWGDEAFETMKMSSATETTRQEEFKDQTDPGFEPAEDIRRICSTVNEEDNTQNMQEEGTILSEKVKDDSVKSNEEVSENVDDAHKSQQETQENSDYSENLQMKSKQRRRKLASTRRDLIRKLGKEMDNKDETEESNLHAESDIRNLDKVEKVAEIPIVVTTDVSQNEKAKLSLSTVHEEQEMNEASTVQDQEQMGHSSTYEMHSTESNMISGLDDLMALLPEESASFSEEVVNAIKSFQVPETDQGERNVVVSVETPPVDDDKSTETFCETTQSDEKGPKDIKVIQGQDTNKQKALKQTTEAPGVAVADLEIVKSAIRGAEEGHKNVQDNIQEPKDVNEGVHNTNFEVKNSSPNVNQTNRRRKLGSSRRSQKKEVDNQATETNIGDAMTECVSGIKEKELQLQKEHKDGDSEPGKEKVFETVEYSHTGDSYTEPPSHQTVEENPAVSGQLVETELHLTPEDIPVKLATSPKYDAMSELAYEGRRRKLGSHRKSHGHQTAREGRIIEAETGRDVKTITDKSGIKTLEENREESEVIESDKKPSSNISISKTGEPVSERISVQHHYAEVRLGQESQKSLSLADNYKGANRYNVVMIGDSSVGKTSFMKRAQSGKFSFDLPASVGLDSCLWNVVVDGKPVVLQLWDTAGQERFHSITRQIFHKAQAFLLIYDITSSESFFAVRYWVDCIKEGAMDDVTVLLLGNKSDCSKREVATQEGEILAKEYNFDFMECSAATGENVVQSLEIVARLLSQKVDTTKDAVVLHKEPQQKKASGCC